MKLELKSLELELKPGIDFFATATATLTIYSLTNPLQILALREEVIIFHVTDSSCNRFVF